jgi:hypothetical protein
MFAAAGLFVGGVALPSAQAADLGGDCCADLEERVAELEATTARKGNRRVSLTISGQVTTALMHWNDGGGDGQAADAAPVGGAIRPATVDTRRSDTYVVDNTFSGGTFFDFSGNARINPDLAAGFQITYAVCGGSRSGSVNQVDDDVPTNGTTNCPALSGDGTMTLTRANWYLDSKTMGRLTVGRQDSATAGLTTIDLGGAGVSANASIIYWQGGMFLIENGKTLSTTWGAALGGGTVSGASLSRGNFVKYSSPTFGGFSVQAAWGEDDVWDVALRYAGEFSGFRLAAGIGYVSNTTGANEVTRDHAACPAATPGVGPKNCEPTAFKGSASILHVASGLFLTGAYVDQDNDAGPLRPNTTLWYLQGGISKNWMGLGNTTLYGEYAQVDDPITGLEEDLWSDYGKGQTAHNIVSSQATMWGLGIVQNIDAAAMELFLSYRRYSFEATGQTHPASDFSEMDVIMSGARIRF